MQLLWKVKQYR